MSNDYICKCSLSDTPCGECSMQIMEQSRDDLYDALCEIRSIVKHTRSCCSCSEVKNICDRFLGEEE